MIPPYFSRSLRPGVFRGCKPSRVILRYGAVVIVVIVAIAVTLLFACTEAPTWPKLLASKISEQYPAYTVKTTDDGNLMVERPGLHAVPVDAQAIGRFCQRGPKDCNYATDLMLLELQPK